jgi:acyl-CoA synthetase (NDP forming)
MDSPDFLEYLAQDPDTKIICLYLEGVRDGTRLTRLVKEINQTKPVIVWKAGLTGAGAQAALSHTGSLGGTREVWDAFFKQAGAIRVNSIEEMATMAMTFLYLQPPRGQRVALLGVGGGNSVASGDTCAEAGLEAPALAPESQSKLLGFISIVNQSVTNPLDIPLIASKPKHLQRVLEIVTADPNVDTIIINQLLGVASREGSPSMTEIAEIACRFIQESPYQKPILVATAGASISPQLQQQLLSAGIPVYSSLSGACRVLYRFLRHKRFLEEQI